MIHNPCIIWIYTIIVATNGPKYIETSLYIQWTSICFGQICSHLQGCTIQSIDTLIKTQNETNFNRLVWICWYCYCTNKIRFFVENFGINLMFMGPFIIIIFYYINPNKIHMSQSLFYLTTALHVSGVTPPTTHSNQFQLFHDSSRQQYGYVDHSLFYRTYFIFRRMYIIQQL